MLVKPDFESKPQEKHQEPDNIALKAVSKESSELGQLVQEEEQVHIRLKAQYRAFIKLIKAKKYTSAILSSRILGVNKNTITLWLNTPLVRKALEEKYSQYISDIEASKDWKSKAYLIDKLEDKDAIKDNTINLTNLIQVNTAPPPTSKGPIV